MPSGTAVIMLDECFREAVEQLVIGPLREQDWTVHSRFRDRPYEGTQLLSVLKTAQIAVIGTEVIDRVVIQNATGLKLICCSGGGVDHVDLSTAQQRGITVTHAPMANTNAVAEFAMALITDRMRRISESCEAVKEGRWPLLVGRHCRTTTLGVVGLGRIGRLTAKKAVGMGFRVIGNDVDPGESCPGVRLVDMDTLLAESQVIVVHVPLTEFTRNLVSYNEFAKMRNAPFLINVSRGGVINEDALIDALERDLICGAALDVFSQEPLPPNSPLRKLGTGELLLTPHMAGSTEEAVMRVGETIHSQLVAFLRGETPPFCATV